MLSIFSRLTAGETMPAREPARYPGPGSAVARRAGGGHLVRGARRWVWLMAVLALIALALVLGHDTVSGSCPHAPSPADKVPRPPITPFPSPARIAAGPGRPDPARSRSPPAVPAGRT